MRRALGKPKNQASLYDPGIVASPFFFFSLGSTIFHLFLAQRGAGWIKENNERTTECTGYDLLAFTFNSMVLCSVVYQPYVSPFPSFIFHEGTHMLVLRDRAQVSVSFLSGKKEKKKERNKRKSKAKRHLLDVTRLLYSCQWFRIRVFEIILLRELKSPTEGKPAR